MILLKRDSELATMRKGGRILAETMALVSEAIRPGVTTDELDAIADRFIRKNGATPSFFGYKGFPKAACISVNEEVVHGIPGGRVIEEGDIVTLDFGVFFEGFHTDSAWTFGVGAISRDAQRLLNVTRESLMQGISKARVGSRVGDVSAAVQKYVEGNGYSVVRDLVGHGIGKRLHEEPSVPNFGKAGRGDLLKAGTTICIEPMVNAGREQVVTLADDWTVVTKDGTLSAHFEHTVAVTPDGPWLLTTLDD